MRQGLHYHLQRRCDSLGIALLRPRHSLRSRRGPWASRQAIGAAHLNQRQTDADRYAMQSEKVLRRLGSPDGRTEPENPK
jgi:hypothetical protein